MTVFISIAFLFTVDHDGLPTVNNEIKRKLNKLIKSFCRGPGGGFYKKNPLELVKGTKRVRFVGWAGLKVI